jgi:hypothetical protein
MQQYSVGGEIFGEVSYQEDILNFETYRSKEVVFKESGESVGRKSQIKKQGGQAIIA